jgi:Tfp pilus assembly protein PilO
MNLGMGTRPIADRFPAAALWQIDAVGLGVCAALGAVWYFAGLQPVSQAAASRETLEAQLSERDTRLSELFSSRSTHQRTVTVLEEKIQAGSVNLRPVDDVNTRISELNTLAVRHDLRIDEVRPGAPVTLPRYVTVPIRLAGTGSYAECSRFMHALRSELRDIGVAGFDLRGEPEAPDKPPTFAFTLVWYAAPAAPPARPSRK